MSASHDVMFWRQWRWNDAVFESLCLLRNEYESLHVRPLKVPEVGLDSALQTCGVVAKGSSPSSSQALVSSCFILYLDSPSVCPSASQCPRKLFLQAAKQWRRSHIRQLLPSQRNRKLDQREHPILLIPWYEILSVLLRLGPLDYFMSGSRISPKVILGKNETKPIL